MTAKTTNRDRRDWIMILILLPIGIFLMMIAGQIAIRIVPAWIVRAGMGSSLDPESGSGGQPGLLQPVSADILTPMSWLESFLTPGPDSANQGPAFAPFVVFEPSSTPSAVVTASISNTPVTPSETQTGTGTSTSTSTSTSTKKPPEDDETPTPPPPPVCEDLAANNYGGPLPCIFPVTSTPEGSLTTPEPETNIGAPDGETDGDNVGHVQDGYYIVLTLSATPIVVIGPSETNYDFVYYERPVVGGGIDMDSVILSISMDDVTYYVVFNWGDGIPDDNSNVGDVTPTTEADNQHINPSELYGSSPQDTGILVDVDNAPSNPPAGTYQYLAIQAPVAPVNDGDDGADIDSIQVIEVAP